MPMIGAQQPYFLPDFFYFYKIYCSDIFLIADHLLFRKQSAITRVRIDEHLPEKYLTVAVKHQANPHPPLKQIEMSHTEDWKRRHLMTLKSLFHKAPYFDYYFPELCKIYKKKQARLTNFLIDLIQWQSDLIFPAKQIIVATRYGINNMKDLRSWLINFEDPVWLISEDETVYYQKNFPDIPFTKLSLCKDLSFPPGYHPQMPLFILLLLRGPETIFYFKNLQRGG